MACDDDEDDNDAPMPTGNDDALDDDEGTIAGTVLTEFIAIDADTLAASQYDTEVAEATVVVPTGGGIVTKEDSAFTAEAPTVGVGTVTLIELTGTGIWQDTAAVGPTILGIDGITWD